MFKTICANENVPHLCDIIQLLFFFFFLPLFDTIGVSYGKGSRILVCKNRSCSKILAEKSNILSIAFRLAHFIPEDNNKYFNVFKMVVCLFLFLHSDFEYKGEDFYHRLHSHNRIKIFFFRFWIDMFKKRSILLGTRSVNYYKPIHSKTLT